MDRTGHARAGGARQTCRWPGGSRRAAARRRGPLDTMVTVAETGSPRRSMRLRWVLGICGSFVVLIGVLAVGIGVATCDGEHGGVNAPEPATPSHFSEPSLAAVHRPRVRAAEALPSS